MKETYALWLCLAAMIGGSLVVRAEHPLIPDAYSRIPESRLKEGVIEADKFRRSLLVKGASGQTRIEVLARACLQFQTKLSGAPKGIRSVEDFKISEKLFLAAAEGSRRWKKWPRTFDAFTGEWFGKWEQTEVDHQWFSTKSFPSAERYQGFHDVYLLAGQFAWIGDGFGWNLIASAGEEGREAFVLGSVYHVQDQKIDLVRQHRPHLGVVCSKQQLIWITAGEVFFEEGFQGKERAEDSYVITGFRYRFLGQQVSNNGRSFQAVYTRDRRKRPEFEDFWLGISAH